MSHYVCRHHDCIEAGGLTAFRTQEELDIHFDRVHRGHMDANKLLGIRFDDEDDEFDNGGDRGYNRPKKIADKPVKLKDKLGINMADIVSKLFANLCIV